RKRRPGCGCIWIKRSPKPLWNAGSMIYRYFHVILVTFSENHLPNGRSAIQKRAIIVKLLFFLTHTLIQNNTGIIIWKLCGVKKYEIYRIKLYPIYDTRVTIKEMRSCLTSSSIDCFHGQVLRDFWGNTMQPHW